MLRIKSLSETGLKALPSEGGFQSVSDFFLVDEKQDLRGRTFKDCEGSFSTITITDMLVDPDEERVVLLELSDGRRIPIEKIRLRGRQVLLQP